MADTQQSAQQLPPERLDAYHATEPQATSNNAATSIQFNDSSAAADQPSLSNGSGHSSENSNNASPTPGKKEKGSRVSRFFSGLFGGSKDRKDSEERRSSSVQRRKSTQSSRSKRGSIYSQSASRRGSMSSQKWDRRPSVPDLHKVKTPQRDHYVGL